MIPEGWSTEKIGHWLEEHREKSEVQDQHRVLTSSRGGLIPQSEYYGESRITTRDNVGFHVIPPKYITYRSRSDDGLFFFNRNETKETGIISHYYPVFRFPKGSDDFFLDALNYWRQKFSAYSVGSSQRVLSLNALRSVKIPIPPVEEQRRIADILSTWDEAIETTEKLIANSEAQKKALMQQLLTCKKRLPGFSGKWQETTIENVASVLVSNVDKKSVNGERTVRLCNYMDVYRSDQILADMNFMAATATEAQIRKFGLKWDDVIITKDSEAPDDIAIPTIVRSTAPNLVCGYHLAILRPKDGTDGQFLKFLFEHPRTRYFFASRANGATRFGLTVGAIETAPISLPSYAEQKEIGNVILAAETEIHRLNPILTALRQEKAALMQQLLTGKRRVKVTSDEKEAAVA